MKRTVNDILNPRRLFRLFSLDVRRDYRGFLITLGAVYAFFLLTSLISGYTRSITNYLYSYTALFIVGGTLITARSFTEYYKRERNTPLLMLPASKTEKWLEKFLLTSIGWIAGSFIGFSVYTLLAAGLNELLFDFHTSALWWHPGLIDFYLHYLVVHAVFFMGSSIFRKMAFFKTILSVFVLGVLLSILTAFFARVLFSDIYHIAVDISRGGIEFGPQYMVPEIIVFMEKIGRGMKILYWAIVPYCWIVSYARFTEIEVKDGV